MPRPHRPGRPKRRTLAYLARLAFGEGDYRVFYNDIVGAVLWLTDKPQPPS